MSEKRHYCFRVEVNCTNAAKHVVSTGDYEDSTSKHDYLDCVDGVLYVKAGSIAEIERLIGPNIISITKLGPCY